MTQGVTPGVSSSRGCTSSTEPLVSAGAMTVKTSSDDVPGARSTVSVPTSREWSSPRTIPTSSPSCSTLATPPPTGAKTSTLVRSE